jgi:DtxR family Mn-dependent transcriptional regulator
MSTRVLSASLEDYLEAIYHIVDEKTAARPKDVSDRLGVSQPSVTSALHALADKRLVKHAPYDIVTLTEEGTRVARRIVHRHDVLREFFVKVLGIDEASAEDSACKVEHAVSEEILERLAQFVDFIRICPRLDVRWIERTGFFCERPDSPEACERCVAECLESVRKGVADDGNLSS